ncbi:MAG: hypothetical protein NT167_05290 [Verrucomicrobia bacterium]|nr:hypothetical protein [Verrucomicrobiota bacterium]
MLTSHELFGFMSPALANEILTYTHEADKPLYQATLSAVADARKLRPAYFKRQPRAHQHELIVATLARPAMEMVSGNLLRVWLLKKHKQMLVDFLDALAIANQEGVVDQLPPTMEDAKLSAAVAGLLAKHPPEAVAVYLHAFNEMNEVEWPNLKTMLDADPRLQLGATA